MAKVLLVLVGGGIGAVGRYEASLLAARLFGTAFPYGTAFVNLIGCLLIGMSFEMAERKGIMGPQMRLFFVTGFLGGLTTFSTYALETANFGRTGSLSVCLTNLVVNNVVGLALVLAGMWLVRELL